MNIKNCPRCLQDHKLNFKELTNPVVDPNPADPQYPCTYRFWALCPNTKEPVLFQDKDLDDLLIPIPPNKSDVEKLAYFIWLYEGKPHGKDAEHWLTAQYALTFHYRIPSIARIKNSINDDITQFIKDKNINDIKMAVDKSFTDYVEKIKGIKF